MQLPPEEDQVEHLVEADSPADAFYPRCEQREDGRWVAWYPEQGIYYEGETEREARAQLPARKVSPQPTIVQLPSGDWQASYPEHGLAAEEPTPSDAVAALNRLQQIAFRDDPTYLPRHQRLLERPPPTWRVEFFSREDAERMIASEMEQSDDERHAVVPVRRIGRRRKPERN